MYLDGENWHKAAMELGNRQIPGFGKNFGSLINM